MDLSSRGQLAARLGGPSVCDNDMRTDEWHKDDNPDGVISFRQAENYLMMETIASHINQNLRVTPRDCAYGATKYGSLRLRRALAVHINRYFMPAEPILSDDITAAAGATAAIEMLAFSLASPGDGILFDRPVYGSFEGDWCLRAGLRPLRVGMQGQDNFSLDCIGHYEEALRNARKEGTNVRILVVCNPHNPLGRCYAPETLRALMDLCSRNSLHLVSDEIYALSTWEPANSAPSIFSPAMPSLFPASAISPTPFTSIFSFPPSSLPRSHIHVLYGLSKDFAAPGLRVGAFISRNVNLHHSARVMARFHEISSLSDAVGAAVLEDHAFVDSFVQESRLKLREAYGTVSAILDKEGVTYSGSVNSGFFLWIDLGTFVQRLRAGAKTGTMPAGAKYAARNSVRGGYDFERSIAHAMLDAGVLLAPGEYFKSAEEGWFRLMYAHPTVKLEEGIRRVVTACRFIAGNELAG